MLKNTGWVSHDTTTTTKTTTRTTTNLGESRAVIKDALALLLWRELRINCRLAGCVGVLLLDLLQLALLQAQIGEFRLLQPQKSDIPIHE